MCHIYPSTSSVRMTEGYACDVRLFPHASVFLRLMTTRWWSHTKLNNFFNIDKSGKISWSKLLCFLWFNDFSPIFFCNLLTSVLCLRLSQTGALLNALVQLCHISTPLAERTWVQLFPRLWKILSDRQQHVSYTCSRVTIWKVLDVFLFNIKW